MKNHNLFLVIISLFFHFSIFSQSLDEETGFIYVKAEYLMETGRYDEAVTNYNQVILKNPSYKNALIQRGRAKYALGAYKGTKNDAIQSIDLKGITPESAALLGRACSAMGEKESAINNFSAAIVLDSKNGEYFYWRAQVYELSSQRLKACSDYEAAALAGYDEAFVKAKNYCGTDITKLSSNNTTVNQNTSSNTTNDNDIESTTTPLPAETQTQAQNPDITSTVPNTIDSTTTPTKSDLPTVDDSEPLIHDENIPKNDDSVNSFVVDEDLKIHISGQELGIRKIKEVPSILILSDENGKVAINICVNKEGQVLKAEFNSTLSTILQKSLVSLALRKAKEFEFEPGKYDSQCGVMIFEVTSS